MTVETLHKGYTDASKRWKRTRDATEGQQKVKEARTEYLPIYPGWDAKKYDWYLSVAYYINITGRTKRGLMGAVFRKPAVVEIPSSLEYLEVNANGAGQGLTQVAKTVTGDVIEVGRYGILSDYPQAEEGLSAAQVNERDLKAYMSGYKAEDIINWSTNVINGREQLSLVVLREIVEVKTDEFSSDDTTRYRVLILNDGLYEQRVYGEGGNIENTYKPRKSDNSRWTEIPFTFIGSENNTPSIDMSPLFDIANINLVQYRNIADNEMAGTVFSQSMLHVDTGDMSAKDWESLNPNGVFFGSSSAIVTSGSGSAQIVQASPNDKASQLVKDKSDEMVSVGARLIDKSSANQTAEAARISASSEMSVLDNVVDNVSNGIKKAIMFCAEFMGDTDDITYELNKEFFDSKMTSQEIMAVIQLADRGDLTPDEVESILARQGLKSSDND